MTNVILYPSDVVEDGSLAFEERANRAVMLPDGRLRPARS